MGGGPDIPSHKGRHEIELKSKGDKHLRGIVDMGRSAYAPFEPHILNSDYFS